MRRSCTQSARTSSSSVGGEQVGVAVERLLGGVDERVGLVAQLGEIAPELVGLLEALAVADEAVDLVRGEAAGRRDPHLLHAVGAEVLRLDPDDAVLVDAEGDLDLGHAARRRRDAGELEAGQAAAVGGHLALALEHVDGHEVLVVDAGGEDLAALGGDGGVARDELEHDAAARLDAERERGDVEEQHLVHLADQRRALERGADGDHLVRVDALVRVAPEELLHRRLHRGHAGHAADEHHRLDLASTAIFASSSVALQQAMVRSMSGADHHLELVAAERALEVERPAARADGDEGDVDLGLERGAEARAWPSPPPP